MSENRDDFFCLLLFGETNLLGIATMSFSAGGAGAIVRGLEAESWRDNTNYM